MPLIAETGGINAMVVDCTALPEQVVDAVVQSAFRSRRPALLGAAPAVRARRHRRRRDRDDRAARRRNWSTGEPARLLATDVGPVIDARGLRRHPAPPASAWTPTPRRCVDRRGASRRPAPLANLIAAAWPSRCRSHRRRDRPRSSARCCTSCAGRATAAGRDRRRSTRSATASPWASRPASTAARRRLAARGARRQRLRQPQHDRRGGGRAAVRRRGPVRHRPEGGRPALPATASARSRR